MFSIQPIGNNLLLVNNIQNKIGVVRQRSSKYDQLVIFSHILQKIFSARSYDELSSTVIKLKYIYITCFSLLLSNAPKSHLSQEPKYIFYL